MAARNGSIPFTSVYFVMPLRRASTAAALMWSGVSKSGAPAEKLTTSIPSDRSLPALAAMARVTEGLISLVLSARVVILASLVVKLFYQLREHIAGDEPGDFAAQAHDFFHQARADVELGLSGHHEKGFQFWFEAVIHHGHLKFILETRPGPQAADNDSGLLALCVVNQQAFERIRLDPAFESSENFPHHLKTLFQSEKRRVFARIGRDSDNDPLEDAKGALYEIYVSVGYGIE